MSILLPIISIDALCLPPATPLPSSGLERVDRLSGLALCAAQGALAPLRLPAAEQVGVCFASAQGCHENDEAYYRGFLAGGQMGASPRLFVYTLPSSPAAEIAIRHGLRGPVLALVSGQSAGLEALLAARRTLLAGQAALVIACAADVATPLLTQLLGPAALRWDGAAALVLGPSPPSTGAPRGHLGPVAVAYCAGDPGQALGRAIAQIQAQAPRPPVRAYADAETCAHLPPGALPCALDESLSPSGCGAFGAIRTIAQLAETRSFRPDDAQLVLASDEHGHGAAALFLP